MNLNLFYYFIKYHDIIGLSVNVTLVNLTQAQFIVKIKFS